MANACDAVVIAAGIVGASTARSRRPTGTIDGAVRDDFRQFCHGRMAGGTPFAQSLGGNRA